MPQLYDYDIQYAVALYLRGLVTGVEADCTQFLSLHGQERTNAESLFHHWTHKGTSFDKLYHHYRGTSLISDQEYGTCFDVLQATINKVKPYSDKVQLATLKKLRGKVTKNNSDNDIYDSLPKERQKYADRLKATYSQQSNTLFRTLWQHYKKYKKLNDSDLQKYLAELNQCIYNLEQGLAAPQESGITTI